jgi:hypothetical protein
MSGQFIKERCEMQNEFWYRLIRLRGGMKLAEFEPNIRVWVRLRDSPLWPGVLINRDQTFFGVELALPVPAGYSIPNDKGLDKGSIPVVLPGLVYRASRFDPQPNIVLCPLLMPRRKRKLIDAIE